MTRSRHLPVRKRPQVVVAAVAMVSCHTDTTCTGRTLGPSGGEERVRGKEEVRKGEEGEKGGKESGKRRKK